MVRLAASVLLSFESELHGLFLRHVIARPQPLHEIEAEISADRLLDHLTLTLSSAGGTNLDSSEDLLIDCQSRSRLCHTDIIAS